MLLSPLFACVLFTTLLEGDEAPTNRLANETSPYLLQHAKNPVDWYPWGPEALERAREEQKPIFLSVGYSACHWCHVMEHESFEDPEIARLMNANFVNIKVDREERPDIDTIYMRAVQTMTGSGGWPMSVFLTPELEPFFGGTYFPPVERYGRPSFRQVLDQLTKAWKNDRENVLEAGRNMAERLRQDARRASPGDLDPSLFNLAFQSLAQRYDARWGGFGQAPKFPPSMALRVLLRHHQREGTPKALEMVTGTLDRMALGGIYDQLGGGFHRYSTDEKWLIPHFEKMLYDNALLVPVLLETYLVTGTERYARVARESCEWALREMVTPEGAFASTQDADSEGEEGKFFVWTEAELKEVLGEELASWAGATFGVTSQGNFEHGKNALWRPRPVREVAQGLGIERERLLEGIKTARRLLLEARSKRVRPGTDDKVLVSWNGLMISAMCQAYQVLGDERYREAAQSAARYILSGMRREDGRLYATARNGKAHLSAYLEDYAFLTQALLDLYESDFDARWITEARALDEILSDHFADEKDGGYFATADDHETLLVRVKSIEDRAIPSGNAVHALNLLRLGELTGEQDYAERAQHTLRAFGSLIQRSPTAFCQTLIAFDYSNASPLQIVIAGDPSSAEVAGMLEVVRKSFRPQRVVALTHAGGPQMTLFEGRTPKTKDEAARAFVCRNFVCAKPAESSAELAEQLE